MSRNHAEWEMIDTAPATGSGEARINVVLPHTNLALTGIALQEALRLTAGLDARVMLLAVRIVPFPEPLQPVSDFPGMAELLALAEGAGAPVFVNIVYARDWESACDQAVARGSLVVMAVRHAWRRSREEQLAEWLSRAGHRVTTVPV